MNSDSEPNSAGREVVLSSCLCDIMSFSSFIMGLFSCHLFTCSIDSIILLVKKGLIEACVHLNDKVCLCVRLRTEAQIY